MALLAIKEAAQRLGVCPSTIYELCAHRNLTHVRVGVGRGTIRVPEQALQDYIAQVTVQPDVPAGPPPSASTPPATSSPAGKGQFRHVRWSQLPDSPPGAAGRP